MLVQYGSRQREREPVRLLFSRHAVTAVVGIPAAKVEKRHRRFDERLRIVLDLPGRLSFYFEGLRDKTCPPLL